MLCRLDLGLPGTSRPSRLFREADWTNPLPSLLADSRSRLSDGRRAYVVLDIASQVLAPPAQDLTDGLIHGLLSIADRPVGADLNALGVPSRKGTTVTLA